MLRRLSAGAAPTSSRPITQSSSKWLKWLFKILIGPGVVPHDCVFSRWLAGSYVGLAGDFQAGVSFGDQYLSRGNRGSGSYFIFGPDCFGPPYTSCPSGFFEAPPTGGVLVVG